VLVYNAYRPAPHFVYLPLWLGILFYAITRIYVSQSPFRQIKIHKSLCLSLIAFLFICLLQLIFFWIPNPFWNGTHNFPATYNSVPLVAIYILLIFVFLDYFKKTSRIIRFFDCLFYLTAILCLFVILYDIIPDAWQVKKFFLRRDDFNYLSSFINRNHFAFFLNLLLPYGVFLLLCRIVQLFDSVRYKAEPLVSSFFSSDILVRTCGVFILLATQLSVASRAGAISTVIGLTGVTLGLYVYEYKRKSLPVLMCLSLVLLGCLMLFIFLNSFLISNFFDQLVRHTFKFVLVYTGQTGEIAGRMSHYIPALDLVWTYPLMGTGIGSFITSFAQVKPFVFANYTIFNAHNDPLQLLVEMGLIGFLFAVIIPLLIGGKWIIQILQKLSDIPRRNFYLFLGLSGCLIATSFHSMLDFSLRMPANSLVFCVLIAAFFQSVYLCTGSRSAIRSTQSLSLGKKGAPVVFFIIIWGLFFIWYESFHIADYYAKRKDLNRAILWNPFDINQRLDALNKMTDYRKLTDYSQEEEEKFVSKILRIDSNLWTYNSLGNYFRGDIERQHFFYERALEKAPNNFSIIRNYLYSAVSVLNGQTEPDEELIEKLAEGLKKIKNIETRWARPLTKNTDLKILGTIESPYLRKKIEKKLQ